MNPECCWCGHRERLDLRPTFTFEGRLVIECVDGFDCDDRAWSRDRQFSPVWFKRP